MSLSFNLDNPPAEPPEGSCDPLLWRTAYQVHADHQPGGGWCLVCRPFAVWPCQPYDLARTALRAAIDANDHPAS